MVWSGSLLALLPLAIVGVWRWGVWVGKVALAQWYEPWRGEVVRLNRPGDQYDIGAVVVTGSSPTDPPSSVFNLGFILGILSIVAGVFGLGAAYLLLFDPPGYSPDPWLAALAGTLLLLGLVVFVSWLRHVLRARTDDGTGSDVGGQLAEGKMAGGASVIVPVYDADPDAFMATVETWLAAVPYELIAVIDHGDEECIRRFRALADSRSNVRCLVTPKPGKRQALVDGVKAAAGDIVVLVDDDVAWRPDTLDELVKPFVDPGVGAVAPTQVVKTQRTLPQKLYEVQMRIQFDIDARALSVVSRSQSVISGRTAAYRREALMPVIDGLTEETFLGKTVISGDDKFLTRAVQRTGWDAVYQSTSVVEIGAAADMETFVRQTIRWTRNTIRSDLKAFKERWIFRRKGLAYYTADRFVSNFAILLAPLYLAVTIRRAVFVLSAAIIIWWLLSRAFKMHPFLRTYPDGWPLVPVYVLASFVQSPIYLYGLFSANTQGWLTRGDDSRFGFNRLRRQLTTSLAVLFTVLVIGGYLFAISMVKY